MTLPQTTVHATAPLILGSWPGTEEDHNGFLQILLGALAAEGVRIVSFPKSRDIRLEGLDALIVHWPDKVFWEASSSREAAALMARLLGRLAGRPRHTKLVWMIHDLNPHEGKWFKRLTWPSYAALLARFADGALTLSEGTRATVLAAYPALADKPLEHIWHPAYPGETLPTEARTVARAELGWTEAGRIYGYCGQLRPYKGVDDLICAFRELSAADARLLVAGRPRDAAFTETLRGLAADDGRILLVPEDLTPERFRACLSACDIVVAPFRRYLHSGSIIHALSAQRPVLTPETPFVTSLAAELGRPDWIQTYQGPLTPKILAGAQVPETPLDLSPLAPKLAAQRLGGFLETLVGRPALLPQV